MEYDNFFGLVWQMLSYALIPLGVTAFILAIAFIVLSKVKKNIFSSPSDGVLKFFVFLSCKSVVCTLIVSATFTFFHFIILPVVPSFDRFYALSAVSVIGFSLFFLIGYKGIGVPLGHGLSMTIEKVKDLDIELSSQVLCFHVDRKFIKNRRAVTDQIVRVVNNLKNTSGEYDFVLRSWLFINRSGPVNSRIKTVRSYMRYIRYFLFSIVFLVVASQLEYRGCSLQFIGFDGVYLAGSGFLIVIMVGFLLSRIRKSAKIICEDSISGKASESMMSLLIEVERRCEGYCVESIGVRPMPKVHVVALSLIKKVSENCIGAEAGFVILRR